MASATEAMAPTSDVASFDDADAAEVELALEHRQRDDPERRDDEGWRKELEELGCLLAEQWRRREGDHEKRR